MAEQRYTGGCHCGRVRFETTADLDKVVSCNCTICSARGLLLTFVTAPNFKLVSGDDQTEYLFNKKHIHHLFCPVCGIESFATGKDKKGEPTYAVNIRCLEGVDPSAVKAVPFDGRSL